MMAPLSEEEENYIRLDLLLKGVSTRAVRSYFDRQFPPTHLASTLRSKCNILDDLKFKRVLKETQLNLLFPTEGVPDSTKFDVTLMICLIRNFTLNAQPINGYDRLPLPVETTPAADLARIKWYRNKIAHHNSKKFATTDFNAGWSNISDAVGRLGGPYMKKECQELKVKMLDQSNDSNKLEIIKLQKEVDKLTFVLEDPIPWNIRVQIQEEVKTWTEDDTMFVETNGAKHVFQCIKIHGCIVVTGSSGMGKSSLVRHVALQMQEEGYDILPVTSPEDIIKWYHPNKKTLFVVDDFCGTYTINPIKFESWKNLIENIKRLLKKKHIKLIMSCRLQVYKDEKMKSLSFYQSCECNLLSKGLSLSKIEKQSIAKIHLKTNASKIEEFYDIFDCFPLLCKLYSKNTKLRIEYFFQYPFTVYKEEIYKLQTEGAQVKYCALALCVMFNNHLPEELFTENIDKDIKTVIKKTYEACKVAKGTSRLVVRDALDSLTHTFIRKDGEVYRTIHDKMFDFIAFYFGSVMIYYLINNASSYFIKERFLFEKEGNSDEFVISVPAGYHLMYINRLINDWLKGKVEDVFCNINMKNLIFRQKFVVHMKGLRISEQKELASLNDKTNKSTALIHCSYIGDCDLVTWCLSHCINNVNHCRHGGISPLYMACHEGHSDVVQMMINNKSDVNQCNDKEESPLYIACQNGHVEVVKILINNKADVNKCNYEEVSPLFIACQLGHIEVVQMLINNKADIYKCKDTGGSPLYAACHVGYTEIVQILINNKADIDTCTNEQGSPLYIACQLGHIEIVNLLIDNNADINKCNDEGISPLFGACHEGHTEVVQILINNNADIDKCNDTGISPLYIAIQNGYTKVVKLLIKNKAGINKCGDNGASPLFVACHQGKSEIIHMLINNNADINNCFWEGASPLYIACQNGHSEGVQMLINNKADINKCRDNDGISPLFIACEKGHTKVVQMLINNKANINKCKDNGASPLHIACQKGQTEIVQMLINNKADINKCRYDRLSPLYIACEEGHTEIVQMLINSKADINNCRANGASPLHISCHKGHTDVIKILINNNADINKCYYEEESPIWIAYKAEHTEMMQMLINNKADINKCRYDRISPLHLACQAGHTEIVQMLINSKADINKCRANGASPLHISCHRGHTEVIKILINNKADINKCDYEEASPILIACQAGHTEIVQMLINNKADINKCARKGELPMFIACQAGHTEIVKLLINNKADISMRRYIEASPLCTSCQNGHTEVVMVLINNNADINKCTSTGKSLLYIACYNGFRVNFI